MNRFQLQSIFADITVNVHKTGKISGDDIFRACIGSVVRLLIGHADGYRFKFHCEGSSKTAARFYVVHFYKLETFNLR